MKRGFTAETDTGQQVKSYTWVMNLAWKSPVMWYLREDGLTPELLETVEIIIFMQDTACTTGSKRTRLKSQKTLKTCKHRVRQNSNEKAQGPGRAPEREII